MSPVIFSTTLQTDAGTQNGNTHVERLEAAIFTFPSGGIKKIRITFEAGAAEGLIITNAYIGHAAAAGDAYDFLATPVQLLFSGAANVTLSTGQSTTTDWANFEYNKTSALLIAYYIGGGTGADTIRYDSSQANATHYNKAANDAATVNKTGYASTATITTIKQVEVEVDGGFFSFF